MTRLLTFIILFTGLINSLKAQVKNVDAETFKKMVDEKKYTLIDLRTSPEISSKGKIRGSVQIDFLDKNAETNISGLDKTKTYLIYCAGGGRSSDCAALMQRTGFKEVINLEKGFDDWKRRGFEIVKD